ncbi:hypothetical protein R1sor_026794 [Riccia sorocarpa]|uniref:Protein kinase domain-containing protein n=1 Tax=Riccia sorocarpa TaxID=122646 RepID=A0ABD3GE45_9MARC
MKSRVLGRRRRIRYSDSEYGERVGLYFFCRKFCARHARSVLLMHCSKRERGLGRGHQRRRGKTQEQNAQQVAERRREKFGRCFFFYRRWARPLQEKEEEKIHAQRVRDHEAGIAVQLRSRVLLRHSTYGLGHRLIPVIFSTPPNEREEQDLENSRVRSSPGGLCCGLRLSSAFIGGRVMGSDDKVRRKEAVRGSRVLPESPKNGYGDIGSPGSNNGVTEFSLDKRWLINPALLFVGAKIGEGAHGKVYQGKYLDQNVAVKILQVPETVEEQSKVEARFAREVAMLCRVEHKNLVKFVGACKEPVMVIVTELLGGKSLRKYLASLRPRRLDLRCAVSFALDIAQAMECLHCNGIIHRDLKPDNLLLTDDKKVVKLVDFGLAREETLTEMMTAETGTYRWMAPELYSTVTLRNGEKKHYNHKVDVYSFGIVLWELLVNRLPFEGMSNLQAAYAAAFKKVRPQIAENLPEDLVFIVQSCWAEDPEIRPNFGQIVRMLNTFLATLPSPRMPDSPLPPTLTPALPVRAPVEAPPFNRLSRNQQQGNDDRDGIGAKSQKFFMWFGQCFLSGSQDHTSV